MPVIYVDNVPYEVEQGKNLLAACLSLGFDLPYFCWHPAMNSIGACRLCAVKQFRDEKDTRGKIVMSCMTPAHEGTRISINDPDAVKFRKSVIEWLMLNHPHDCPVCDEGGECHLQDMTLLSGRVYRRTRFKKRTHRNQYLGPFLNHEMNRCIQCYRCVRFYCDYAGARDLNVFAWHDDVYFGRTEDGILQSEFAGNLVEVCPTGVFTDKTLKEHYTRKWDLQTAPSVCVHCSLGCNIIPGERYGMLRRIQNRFNHEVNGYFLCDRGRYGYGFVNHLERIRQPLLRRNGGELRTASREEVLKELAPLFENGSRIVGIGSARASIETNFALRSLVGAENFYLGVSRLELDTLSRILDILQNEPIPSASLHDVEQADAVLVLGEDVPNTAPIAALALRQSVLKKALSIPRQMRIDDWHDMAVREAIQKEYGPLFIASLTTTRLDDIATRTLHPAPDDIARCGFAVAHEIDPDAPAAPGMSEETLAFARQAADALRNAQRPLIVSGSSCLSFSVVEAAANVARALVSIDRKPNLFYITSTCNSTGAALLSGKPVDALLDAAERGSVDAAVIVECDIYRCLGSEAAGRLLDGVGKTITIDSLPTSTSERADVVLPAATFAESEGTFINNEGRGQRYFKVFQPDGAVQESWRWLSEMIAFSNRRHSGWRTLDEIITEAAGEIPVLRLFAEAAPPADFRLAGQKIARQTHRHSGRTAIHANVDVNEPKPPDDPDSPLAFSMEGFQNRPPAALIPRFWAPYWNSVQSVNKFQSEVNGPLQGGDAGKRLIEPKEGQTIRFSNLIPSAFEPRKGEVLVFPSYHVFGSEELSNYAPGIIELSPEPYLSISEADARLVGVHEGEQLDLNLFGARQRFIIHVDSSLSRGLALAPIGLSGQPWTGAPFWYEMNYIKKVSAGVADN